MRKLIVTAASVAALALPTAAVAAAPGSTNVSTPVVSAGTGQGFTWESVPAGTGQNFGWGSVSVGSGQGFTWE
jgi:hypothetical protein